MNKAQQLTGKIMLAKYGKVKILRPAENSRTKVIVQDIDRGEGWNEEKQTYTGHKYKGKNGWYWFRGENHNFGEQFTTHINNLKSI